MGRQVFTAGEILTAANMNDLSDQSVMVFDDATARTTAIPTPVEGMTTYLKDTDLVEVFDGSDFVPVAIEPDPPAILQVVSTTKTDTFTASVTAGDDVAVPGLSVSITPSSTSSKVLVMASLDASDSNVASAAIARDGTLIGLADASGSRNRTTSQQKGGNDFSSGLSLMVLDSPASTSALTYQVHMINAGGATNTTFVNRSLTDSDNAGFARSSSTITAMEVAG